MYHQLQSMRFNESLILAFLLFGFVLWLLESLRLWLIMKKSEGASNKGGTDDGGTSGGIDYVGRIR